MKLLIVEDSFSVRQILRSLAAPFANEIDECADGNDAIRLYETVHPDIVLMDISLTETDGIAATRQIVERDPAARIIIVTNFDEDDLREEAKNAGACGYVLKDNLLDVVNYLTPENAI
jgi:two-component system response regulator DegU